MFVRFRVSRNWIDFCTHLVYWSHLLTKGGRRREGAGHPCYNCFKRMLGTQHDGLPVTRPLLKPRNGLPIDFPFMERNFLSFFLRHYLVKLLFLPLLDQVSYKNAFENFYALSSPALFPYYNRGFDQYTMFALLSLRNPWSSLFCVAFLLPRGFSLRVNLFPLFQRLFQRLAERRRLQRNTIRGGLNPEVCLFCSSNLCDEMTSAWICFRTFFISRIFLYLSSLTRERKGV